ncbi:hypothetical protein EJB05_01796, partial [Eragrostis curvula]
MGADGGGRKATAKAAEGGAGTLLAGLPCRGNFTESNIASSMGGLKVYICLHDTAPPEGQVVKTDANNILIRALQLSKQKSEAKDVGNKTPGESSKGKRLKVMFEAYYFRLILMNQLIFTPYSIRYDNFMGVDGAAVHVAMEDGAAARAKGGGGMHRERGRERWLYIGKEGGKGVQLVLGKNASRSLDSRNPSKRPNTGNSAGSSAHESPSDFSELTLQSFTVEKLRSLLKAKGLSPKGKKASANIS